jgi:hypothetical protein
VVGCKKRFGYGVEGRPARVRSGLLPTETTLDLDVRAGRAETLFTEDEPRNDLPRSGRNSIVSADG